MTDVRRPVHRCRSAVVAGLAAMLLLCCAAQARAENPSITINGAGVLDGGWVGGAPRISADAIAAAGVSWIRLRIDGQHIDTRSFECHYGWPVPCPQAVALYSFLPTALFSDGYHSVTVEASDSYGAVATASAPLLIDNTAPAAPRDLVVDGGVGWRAQPARRVSWTDPKQQFAPITEVRYRLCPADADSADPQAAARAKGQCVDGAFARPEPTDPPEPFELPKPGLWTLRLWLVDAAGSSNPDAASVVAPLGYDQTPPHVDGFASQDPNDPARVSVTASEDVSPLEGGSIEVQRQGSQVWRPLATEVHGEGISALVDDATLRKGRYRLRATVTNAAGLQQSTDRTTSGQVMTLSLPIRTGSQLQTGRPVGTVCRGRGANRRCQRKLRRKISMALGHRITLRGRLIVGGRPISRQPLELWERVSVGGAAWQRIGSVETDRHGGFRYRTAKGPARELQFRYPGTPHIRSDVSTVRLRVRADSTIKVSRRNVINGEYVTFSGNVRGGHRPLGGLLVELQVRSRGQWRTFAQTRADEGNGAWRYQYRFETVKGRGRFSFRARVRRQPGYPYATGSSRTLGVRVEGL